MDNQTVAPENPPVNSPREFRTLIAPALEFLRQKRQSGLSHARAEVYQRTEQVLEMAATAITRIDRGQHA